MSLRFDGPEAHRVLAVGATRSGKSELLNVVFTDATSGGAQGVLIDPKGTWRIPGLERLELSTTSGNGRGAVDAARAELERVDWTADYVHIVPGWMDRPALTALFERVGELRHDCVVWVDEAYAVADQSWCPDGLLKLHATGAERGHAALVATQRPVRIARILRTEAEHLFVFGRLEREDISAALEGATGVRLPSGRPFTVDLAELELSELPDHGYLWIDRTERAVRRGRPIPDEWRRGIAVKAAG